MAVLFIFASHWELLNLPVCKATVYWELVESLNQDAWFSQAIDRTVILQKSLSNPAGSWEEEEPEFAVSFLLLLSMTWFLPAIMSHTVATSPGDSTWTGQFQRTGESPPSFLQGWIYHSKVLQCYPSKQSFGKAQVKQPAVPAGSDDAQKHAMKKNSEHSACFNCETFDAWRPVHYQHLLSPFLWATSWLSGTVPVLGSFICQLPTPVQGIQSPNGFGTDSTGSNISLPAELLSKVFWGRKSFCTCGKGRKESRFCSPGISFVQERNLSQPQFGDRMESGFADFCPSVNMAEWGLMLVPKSAETTGI